MDQSDEAALEKVEQVISIDCQNSYSAMNMVIIASFQRQISSIWNKNSLSNVFLEMVLNTSIMGKKLKMRKIRILWHICQKSSKCDFNTFNIVKFDSRLVLMSSIFQFQNTFVPKKDNIIRFFMCLFTLLG